jgi:putative addiction module killer protein
VRSVCRKEIVYFQQNDDDRCPFLEWMETLEKSRRDIIKSRIWRVGSGNYGDYKSVGEGVLELRFHQGYRIYFTEKGNTIVILLCGGDKSSQEKDIAQAKEYKKILDGQKSNY